MNKAVRTLLFFFLLLSPTLSPVYGQKVTPKGTGRGCLSCHRGIQEIRDPSSGMMKAVYRLGAGRGDPRGCVVCHGGDPSGKTREEAHGGKAFYPDPGSPWINAKTCGLCHPDHVRVQWQSLMMTEAGKIQGVAWTFGAMTGYRAKWGNYVVSNPKDPAARLGTKAYRACKEELARREPQAFPSRLEALPGAPADPAELAAHPEKAAFTYLRSECERCHWAVRGRQTRGDFRGMGCSACHIPYGNEGLYEGKDESIPRGRPGHMLVHRIQGTRKAKLSLHGKMWSGIPVETCTTCHDRGKRIGVSYQGLMETAYHSPWDEAGKDQPTLHSKHYLAMREDVHYRKGGMVCMDCHTSLDVHGDGFLAGSNLGSVEIECADCHGTPEAFPWELPLGYGDEFGRDLGGKGPRGTSGKTLPIYRQGTIYPAEDGYLLTARGNPFPNVVRRGDLVVVHTAGGRDLELKPLKLLIRTKEMSPEGRVAMAGVKKHTRRMECYACHASWAPQCYGCHVKVDYSGERKSFDWVAAGRERMKRDRAADNKESGYDKRIPGKVFEQRSYLRWEDPALGVNGENRVTPIVPGCQPVITVLGPGGKPLLLNKAFRTPKGMEGGGEKGQLCLDMSPTNPHTSGHPRSCESCHASRKACGYGIGGGEWNRPWNKPAVIDLQAQDGTVLPSSARPQVEAIPGLKEDWSVVVTPEGKQVQTVGHHFTLSRPLNSRERAFLDRSGACLACHREIPAGSAAVSLLHHVAKTAGLLPVSSEEHGSLIHKILLFSAWGQALPMVLVPLALLGFLLWRLRRRARRKAG